MKKLLTACVAAVLLLSLAACGKTDTDTITDSKADKPAAETAGVGTHHAEIDIQDYGTITVELDGDAAPITVQNFMNLANDGFYDGLTFHRIIDGFMIQGGDPEGTGMGGPGYTIEDEFVDDLRFDGEGILAMANTGMPHTGGSQFFITLDKTPWLNGHHTIFGKVKEGMDVVRRIGHSETDMADRPLEDVVIKTIEIKYPE